MQSNTSSNLAPAGRGRGMARRNISTSKSFANSSSRRNTKEPLRGDAFGTYKFIFIHQDYCCNENNSVVLNIQYNSSGVNSAGNSDTEENTCQDQIPVAEFMSF